jgi:hypothetical protein
MPDNVAYTPGSGATIAADDIGGVLYQRVKVTHGVDGIAHETSDSNPYPIKVMSVNDSLPTVANQSDDLLRMLSRLVKILECNAVVDQQQRQRVTIDAITGSLVLGTVSTVSNLGTVSTVSTVAAQTTLGGMDREMYINIAKNTYANSIRSQLSFV